MSKLLLALALFASACAPAYYGRPYRARYYAPRAYAPVVIVPRHHIWW